MKHVFDGGSPEFVLAAEMIGDHGVGGAGQFRDVSDLGRAKALSSEDFQGGIKDVGARLERAFLLRLPYFITCLWHGIS